MSWACCTTGHTRSVLVSSEKFSVSIILTETWQFMMRWFAWLRISACDIPSWMDKVILEVLTAMLQLACVTPKHGCMRLPNGCLQILKKIPCCSDLILMIH